ncbi:SRPBCC family protein [Streptomyces sp. NBC_01433]|uniref:SRPBCC family protein n=1 Tax=Streptomyces sp. NBC_01433 TaxID=2903864 RepID=UPI00224D89ED|nr:SRPBCC family protein [Streptomyces sp. NBC_01433]MCX4679503.1 SRPBCC family protein [Streptomyces sp. NBC_01433]
MAIRHRLIHSPPHRLWEVLRDASRYGDWVVGTDSSRAAGGIWPEVGSSIEYTVRLGRKEFHGRTVVRLLDPPGALELEAHSGPLGTARIAFDIRPWGDDTLVLVDEHPLRGIGGQLHNAAVDALLQMRHRTMLRRLAEVVEARADDDADAA